MPTNITRDWSELFDVALLEPNRARLRKCISNAKLAIRNRLDALMRDPPPQGQGKDAQSDNSQTENASIVSERLALSDALITLSELHKIVYARKSSPAIKREEGSAPGPASPQ